MSDAIAELENLEIKTPEGKLAEPRLKDAASLRTIYTDLIRDDQGSATARARVQAMVDGEPPFNQAALNASGQGSRANANFLMGHDLITKANNGYNDIITSVKSLMTADVEGGEPNMRLQYGNIICTELTRTIRKWKKFTHNFQRTVNLFTTHGVGFSYFPDTIDFRFEVAGLSEFLIPRQTQACEDEIPYAVARKDMSVTKLAAPLRNEQASATMGWNIPAVKAALDRATTQGSRGEIGEQEKLQQQIKNNDIYTDRQFGHVPVIYGWIQEFDGKVSLYMAEKDGTGDFLYEHPSKYDSIEEALVAFCYGIGNGTFHSVRGLGHMIFALVQLHNRLMCQKADGVMLEESVMVQATTANALQNASVNYIGPFSILSDGFDVIDRKMGGGNGEAMPFMRKVEGMMGQTASRFMAPQKEGSGVYENQDTTDFNLESIANGDSGAIDLFYVSLDRLVRQMCIRIINGPKSDKLVGEFHRRCEKAGVTEEILKSVDFDSIYAYRALGAGSPAARSIAFKKLMQIMPQLDEIGRKNMIYAFVEDAVGFQNAARFASPAAEPRLGPEAGMAELENMLLIQGNEIPVYSEQLHGTHIQIHLPKIYEVLDGVERGEIDPMESLQGLQASLNHIAAHGEAMVIDPTQEAIHGQVQEAVNNLQQVVTNMERKIKAAQRKEAESGTVEGSPEAENATQQRMEEVKLALAEFKLNAAIKMADLKYAAEQGKIAQSFALNDVKAAQQAQLAMRFPGTQAFERR